MIQNNPENVLKNSGHDSDSGGHPFRKPGKVFRVQFSHS